MFIGEAPGEAEGRTGKPFQGASGKLLRAELSRVKLDDVYITNVAKCRPPDNDTPTNDQIKACRKYLEEEIATVNPDIVVPLGATAIKAVLKLTGVKEHHGKLLQWEGRKAYPMYHPAYILRDPSHLPAFRTDLERLARISTGTNEQPFVDWGIVSPSTLDEFFGQLREADDFTFDCETSGLFPFDLKGHISCLAIALEQKAWSLPLKLLNSPFASNRVRTEMIHLIADMVEGKTGYAWNGKFDNHWLWLYYQVRFHLNMDGMLAHHVLDENDSHELKVQARNKLNAPNYDLPLKDKLKPDTPYKALKLLEYNAYDGAYTRRLCKRFEAEFRKDPVLRKLFYRLVMPAARAMDEIECVGMTLDMQEFAATRVRNHEQLMQLLIDLRSLAKREVNWNSPQQVAKLFFEDLKLPIIQYTDGGNPSTAEATLVELKDRHPVVKKLVEYREAEKFRSTYLDGWFEYIVGDKIFFSYKLHGTVTGRYSSRLHQTPRDGTIRNLATAPPGFKFVQLDISQAEMRTAAEYSRDPELIRCFHQGIDTHWRTILHALAQGAAGDYVQPALDTAARISGSKPTLSRAIDILLKAGHDVCISLDNRWKEARKKAKGINFGFLFGMFEKKFMLYTKMNYGFEVTKREATAFRQAFFTLYPGLQPWHAKQRRLVHLNGYVRSLTGRMRRLPGVHSSDWELRGEAERQAINSPVQGFVGDYKAMCLVEIHEDLPHTDVQIVGEHHDALLAIFREETIDIYLPKALAIMRKPKLLAEFGIHLKVPFEADAEVGNWGKGVKYVEKKS